MAAQSHQQTTHRRVALSALPDSNSAEGGPNL